MWKSHFSNLYNTLNDNDRSQCEFFSVLAASTNNQTHSIAAADAFDAIRCQKKNKSAGPNGLYMESFILAGEELSVHLSILFTLCMRHRLQKTSLERFMH